MAAPPCDKPVPYCSCIMRRANLDGTLTNTTCDWCERLVPDDKAIYLVLKDHVRHLQLLGSNKNVKWKKMKKKNGKGPVMDAIESLPDREDIQKLLTKYEAGVLRASVRVLVEHDSSELRSLLSSIWRDFPPTVEPGEVADEEAIWDARPEPAAEQAPPYDYLCEPEIAAQDYQETKDAEPEAIEEEYVEVRDIEEKSFDDDPLLSGHEDDDYGDNSTSNKPVDSDTEEGPVGICETPVKDARSSNEETGEERAQENKDMICLPFDKTFANDATQA
ncbi:unnamed protein product [Fusarium langsethiae]|nr:unnamed protein product [Fusarium langsethiae]